MKTPLYNPIDNFSYEWLDDNNIPHTLTMKGYTTTSFPEHQANFMVKHLVDKIFFQRGVVVNPELDRIAIEKEIREH